MYKHYNVTYTYDFIHIHVIVGTQFLPELGNHGRRDEAKPPEWWGLQAHL